MPKRWTKEENELFIKLYPTMSKQELAEYFQVTLNSVKIKASRLGITNPVNKRDRGDLDFFEKIDTEEKAYWLGFIYADGYVITSRDKTNWELGIELSPVDIEHLNKFNSIFKNYYKIKIRERSMDALCKYSNRSDFGRVNTMCNIRVYSKKIVKDLNNLGVVQNKTNSSVFPVIEDDILFLHFLRGYIDGDGSYYIHKKKSTKRVINYPRINITGNNKEIFEYIQQRLLKFEIGSIICKDRNSWKLEIKNTQGYIKLVDLMFKNANIYLDRKYEKVQEINTVAVLNRNI